MSPDGSSEVPAPPSPPDPSPGAPAGTPAGDALVERSAPAKVNLTLAVLGRRSDGFRDLHSVMVPVGLSDRLQVAHARGAADELSVEGFDPGPPDGNLVLRAFAAVRAALGPGVAAPALSARLEKRIPVAAGLGGGSSDAAAAIDACLACWGEDLPSDARLAVAASLGSDVPFFLAGGPALVEGRGERVSPLPGLRGTPPGILLVTPRLPVPTAAVFAALSAGGAAAAPGSGATRLTSEHLASELRAGLGSVQFLARAGVLAVANDLIAAAAAVAPGLVLFRRALSRLLGSPIGLSGSGPTLWALYPSLAAAAIAADAVAAALADERLAAPGDGRPHVVATTILSGTPDETSAIETAAQGDHQ